MEYSRDYRQLEVWRRAHLLTLAVYRATAGFPSGERFGLTSQLRRAVASIPTNLAEGKSRTGERSFAAFVDIAAGSAGEVDYLVFLARELELLPAADFALLAEEINQIGRMLTTLHHRLSGHELQAVGGRRW